MISRHFYREFKKILRKPQPHFGDLLRNPSPWAEFSKSVIYKKWRIVRTFTYVIGKPFTETKCWHLFPRDVMVTIPACTG